MVSTRPPTSKSSRPLNNPLVTVPKAPITIDIIVTFMFHSFFNSLARSRSLSLFFLWGFSPSTLTVGFPMEFEWQQVSSILQDSFQYSGWILGCVYTTCSYGRFSIYCTIPRGSLPKPVVSSLRLFLRWFAAFTYHVIVLLLLLIVIVVVAVVVVASFLASFLGFFFYTSVSWGSFIGDWMKANHLVSPGLFWVF